MDIRHGCLTLHTTRFTLQDLRELFGTLDTDGGGEIDRKELVNLMCVFTHVFTHVFSHVFTRVFTYSSHHPDALHPRSPLQASLTLHTVQFTLNPSHLAGRRRQAEALHTSHSFTLHTPFTLGRYVIQKKAAEAGSAEGSLVTAIDASAVAACEAQLVCMHGEWCEV